MPESKSIFFTLRNSLGQRDYERPVYIGVYEPDKELGFLAEAEIDVNGTFWAFSDEKAKCFKIADVHSWVYLFDI